MGLYEKPKNILNLEKRIFPLKILKEPKKISR